MNRELIADCYADTHEGFGIPEDYRANARLIAAAPELLAALKYLLPIATRAFGVLTADLDSARDAIAKAEGAQ